jgi:hypothetical protein
MKMIKTAFAAVFAVLVLTAAANAAELNTLTRSDVQALTAGLQPPLPLNPLNEALSAKDSLDPVVITVSGLSFGEIGWGPLELKNFIRLIKMFLPNKEINEEDLVNGLMAFNKDYFFLEDAEDARELALVTAKQRLPDNYLEAKLKEIPGYENHNVVVVPFTWSRDPGDTEKTVPELEKKIIQTYDAYKNTGKPFYMLAHSWGSVLTHEALHRISRYRPDVRIDKLITAGSPLVPANFVVSLFIKYEIRKEHLEKAVTKPSIVKTWRNFWAKRDAYSNAIPAADYNLQADFEVENVEPTLINLILHSKPLKKEAKRDLFKIRDLKAWHGAYFFDYQASLLSINKEISVTFFQPVLAPQVMDCVKNPVPMCLP